MSKEDKHIDNLFQEKLSDRSFDGPPADFLADLNQRLDDKAVVSKGWIWIVFLNLFIIGLFIVNATVDFSSTKTTEVAQQIDSEEQNTEKENSLKSEDVQKNSTSAKTDDAQSISSQENERLNNTQLKAEGSDSNKIEKNQNKNNNADSDNQSKSGIKTKSDNQSINRESSNINKSSGNKDASTISDDSNDKASKETNDAGSDNPGSNQIEKSAAGNKRSEANKDKDETEKSTSNEDIARINSAPSLSSYVSYSEIFAPQFEEVDRKIKSNDFPKFPNTWNELANEENIKSPDMEEGTDKRMFEIQLQGGATHWNYKTLGTNDNYVTELDQSGTPKWTPNFGLGFNVNFNNISVGTGIDYAKFKTENLFAFSEVTSYDSTYVAGYNENVTYDSLGNPIDTTYTPYYDSTTVTDTTYNTTSITNQYEWIQIPLHIGYRFNLNKWAIIPRVGMNIGLGIRQSSGQYPNEAYDELQAIDPVKWQLNLHTSLEIRREFGRWHAFGKFNYQRNLTPTIDNALFERKYNGIGFRFGVGYLF